jgi:crotonobetainyl-CoA:carnitine CoA-transferase CaiB-like acyl-CoA transferase
MGNGPDHGAYKTDRGESMQAGRETMTIPSPHHASALQGIRVLDFTQQVSGPLATMLLADFGADVIKVEPPEGEAMRRTGETFFAGEAVYFLSLNRNKRGIVLDLATPEGRETAQRMAREVDIVAENFRPGVAERLGIDYATLSAQNPRLIYLSTSAFGRDGPDSKRPGMDPVVQAMSGVMQLTGDERSGPLKAGMPFSDVVTPLMSTIGVLAALQARNITGRGQRVDVAMIDASIFCMLPREQYYFSTGRTPARIGNSHYEIVPYNTYETSDGRFVMVIAHTDKHWQMLANAAGAGHLLTDARLERKAGRLANRDLIDHELGKAFASKPLAYWNQVLSEAEVMFAPVRTFEEVFEDPRIKRNLVTEHEHSVGGKFRLVANPINLSETPATTRRVPPMLGQHTQELLAEFGLDLRSGQ